MPLVSDLNGAADAITMFANIRDTVRGGARPRVDAGEGSGWTGDDEISLIAMARGQVLGLMYESLDFHVERASDLEARLRILCDGARIVGVDHPVIAEAAKALARDVERFSPNAG